MGVSRRADRIILIQHDIKADLLKHCRDETAKGVVACSQPLAVEAGLEVCLYDIVKQASVGSSEGLIGYHKI